MEGSGICSTAAGLTVFQQNYKPLKEYDIGKLHVGPDLPGMRYRDIIDSQKIIRQPIDGQFRPVVLHEIKTISQIRCQYEKGRCSRMPKRYPILFSDQKNYRIGVKFGSGAFSKAKG